MEGPSSVASNRGEQVELNVYYYGILGNLVGNTIQLNFPDARSSYTVVNPETPNGNVLHKCKVLKSDNKGNSKVINGLTAPIDRVTQLSLVSIKSRAAEEPVKIEFKAKVKLTSKGKYAIIIHFIKGVISVSLVENQPVIERDFSKHIPQTAKVIVGVYLLGAAAELGGSPTGGENPTASTESTQIARAFHGTGDFMTKQLEDGFLDFLSPQLMCLSIVTYFNLTYGKDLDDQLFRTDLKGVSKMTDEELRTQFLDLKGKLESAMSNNIPQREQGQLGACLINLKYELKRRGAVPEGYFTGVAADLSHLLALKIIAVFKSTFSYT